jgi:hypothetical protein
MERTLNPNLALTLKYIGAGAIIGVWVALDYFKINDPVLQNTLFGILLTMGVVSVKK